MRERGEKVVYLLPCKESEILPQRERERGAQERATVHCSGVCVTCAGPVSCVCVRERNSPVSQCELHPSEREVCRCGHREACVCVFCSLCVLQRGVWGRIHVGKTVCESVTVWCGQERCAQAPFPPAQEEKWGQGLLQLALWHAWHLRGQVQRGHLLPDRALATMCVSCLH